MMVLSILFVTSYLSTIVYAANDWSKPCFNGQCEYDLPSSNSNSSSGTLKIVGSPSAIADITPAAGWEIINCSPDALAQDIRLVCKGDNTTSCARLYQNSAEGKIVRLPQNCGKSAFARIAKAWVPEDQSIPSNVTARISRRDGKQPEVKALALDTNFQSLDKSKIGDVNFTIYGANVPGLDLSDIGNDRRRGFLSDALDTLRGKFDVDKSSDLPPIDFDKKFNLFNKELSCPPVKAAVSVNVEAKAHALVTVGIVASGSVIPPKLDNFGLVSTVTADLTGGIDLVADLSGTLDSGKIKIFEVGIPGLDFPGFLSIGPTFEVNAQAKATLDVLADLNVGLNYHVEKAQFQFPPNQAKQGGDFQIQDTPLKLSASPSVKVTGSVEGHIIPSLNLGLSAFDGLVDSSIFLELDTSAKLTLTADAVAEAGVVINKAASTAAAGSKRNDYEERTYVPPYYGKRSGIASTAKVVSSTLPKNIVPTPSTPKKASSTKSVGSTKTAVTYSKPATVSSKASSSKAVSSRVAASTDRAPPASATVSQASAVATTTATPSSPNVSTETSASFGGCVDITAGFDVNAGANADFFGLFDVGKTITLFSKQFELFKKCFGDQAKKTARRNVYRRAKSLGRRAGLTCAAPNVGKLASLVDQTIGAAGIKAS